MEITSINNDKVKYWSKLNDKKFRDIENKYLAEGDHLVKEALNNNQVVEIITTLDLTFDVPTYNVNELIMSKISTQKSIPNIIAVCNKNIEKDITGRVLVLDNIQDPGNLGTIIRSAIAFNFNNIILTNNCVDLYNEKVIRSCEGMIYHINIVKYSIEEVKEFLSNNNYQVIGTDVNEGKLINDINYQDNIAIVIGSEGRGMSDELRSICDDYINLPISAKCESLNAAVAASIIMYELDK